MDWECCWDRDVIAPGDCPNIGIGDEDLLSSQQRRILEKCADCENFKRDLKRFRESGHPLAPVFFLLHQEYQRQKTQIQSLVSFLDSKTLEVRFLHELGSVLQSSVDLEEVLSVALTAITAGKGFGMNRAFLLLSDKERNHLQGFLAIGPRNYEEAGEAWNEIVSHDMDLQTLAQTFRKSRLIAERAKFQDILQQLSIPLTDTEHFLIRILNGKHAVLIDDAFHHSDVPFDFARLLGVDTFLVMPLISRNRRVGMIIADNCITRRSITEEDIRSLETFSFPVAFAIERASLYDRLQDELNRVTEASRKLKEQQELIVRMEKMALVGRITSSVAHSIRNPLMIIGGFARSMLRDTPQNDSKRDFIESIVGETRQLEGVLDEILNYSDSLYPTMDFWEINQLVNSVLTEVGETMQARGSSCEFTAGENLPAAYIDFKQISYCLRAILLSNLDDGTNSELAIMTYKGNDSVVIRIEDRTSRKSQQELDAMLMPFSSTQDLGAGLGLALCKTMLDKQGLPFSAEAVDNGIVYTISLPIRKEEQQ